MTYARVRREPPRGFAEARHFLYPANSLGAGASGTPLFTREAISEAVQAGRRLSEGRLSRASVVFPDSWARLLPVDFDTLPNSPEAVREVVLWRLKKLLPGVTSQLSVLFREMPSGGEEKRLLVAAAPAETLHSIEQAFDAAGVRVGALVPASLALFEGLAPALGAAAKGDYALAHRSPGSFVFLVARESAPLFFRQRPEDSQEADGHDQEVRLSLTYYTEKLKGSGLSEIFVHDGLPGEELKNISSFPRKPVALSGRLFEADADFDARVAARPELLPGFAAVFDQP